MVNASGSFPGMKLPHLQAPNTKGWQGTQCGAELLIFVLFFLPFALLRSISLTLVRERVVADALAS